LYKNYVSRDLIDIISINSSNIIRNLFNEISVFTSGLNVLSNFLIELLTSIALLALLLYTDFYATLFMFGSLTISLFIYLSIISPIIRTLSKEKLIMNGKVIKLIQETFDLIKIIKTTKKEKLFINNYKDNVNELNNVDRKRTFLSEIINNSKDLFLIIVLILPFSYFLFIKDIEFIKAIPTLTIFLYASIKIFPSAIKISSCIQSLNAYQPSIVLVMKELAVKVKEKIIFNNTKDKFLINTDIIVQGLSFNYDDNHNLFNNLNFNIKKNKLNFFFGKSGSGKTTLINLISCLIKPKKGKMIVNDIDILASDQNIQNDWMSSIGYISQESILASTSILENITLFEKNFDKHLLEKSLLLSNLNDFVKNNSEGLMYQVGESGDKLSGGQKQRINIARALYHSPSLLICDEITSSLDNKNKYEIIKEINKLKQNLTVIFITHDETLKSYADNIINLNDEN
jgi:ATP-binding cassette subfamily C protein